MLQFFDPLRDITLLSVALRLFLSVICGGVIGIEREYRRRPAGFRTHILICMGAALTTLTSQYLGLVLHYQTDLARLGAQVIAGVGFIGAGTIIVNSQQRVKGLTTAAGLWTTAIVGLALGAGFYEGGVAVCLLVLCAEMLFSRLEYRILNNTPEINIYMEYVRRPSLDSVIAYYRDKDVKILSMQFTRATKDDTSNACVIFGLRLNKHIKAHDLIAETLSIPGVIAVEEL